MPDALPNDADRRMRFARSELPIRGPGIQVQRAAPTRRLLLQGSANAAVRVALPLGWILDAPLLGACVHAQRSALRIGPLEWLLLEPVTEDGSQPSPEVIPGPADEPEISLVDISDRHEALEVTGLAARDLLSSGCPLDLAPAAFPVGRCTRTVLAKIEIVLWRFQPEAFRVEYGRSFDGYACAFLAQAARDL